MLEREGYQVRVSESVKAALAMIESETPDVIVCDLVLPFVDGLDFLKQRLTTPKLAKIPVVIVSSTSEEPKIEQALSLGASEALRKPFGRVDLVGVIMAAVGKTQGHG